MKVRFPLLVALIVLCSLSTRAFAQNCGLAEPPSTDGALVIDARNGSFSGQRQFRVGEQTRVLLVHKNPFRYAYVLKIEESVIQEDAIGKFFAFAGISADPPAQEPPPGGAAPPPVTPPTGGAVPLQACSAAVVADITARHVLLQTTTDALKTAIVAEIKRYDDFTDEAKAKLLDPDAKGPQLCEAAVGVVTRIKAFQPAAIQTQSIDPLRALISAQKAALAGCRPPASPDFNGAIEKAAEMAKWAEGKLEELEEREEDLDKLAVQVENTLKRADAFWEMQPLGPHGQSTKAEISVTQKDTTVPNASAKTIRPVVVVNFGGRRFFLAGGIAASSADLTRFKTIDGFVLDRDGNPVKDANGNPKFGKVVGLEEESVGRVSPAVLLHGILWRPKRFADGVGLSLGMGSTGSDESVIEFFAGPTISFAEDHLFLTLGAFRGEESQLAGDFYVGAEVPATATLSTVKRKTWTFGLGLTFRIP